MKNKKMYYFIGIILIVLIAGFYSGSRAKTLEKEYKDYNPILGIVVSNSKKTISVTCEQEECKKYGDNLVFTLKKPLKHNYRVGDIINIQIHGEEASETYSEEELKSTIDNLSFIKTASIMFIIFFIGGFIVFKKKIISAMIPGLIWITILFLLTRDSIPWYIVVLCILLLLPGSVLAEFIAMKEK